jgi:TRAP-type mannitol/chloroaromatic compound transport system substrate-binding protein
MKAFTVKVRLMDGSRYAVSVIATDSIAAGLQILDAIREAPASVFVGPQK